MMILTEDRRRSLRIWLRSKSFAPDVVRSTLAWTAAEMQAGREPSDAEILAQAEHDYEHVVTLPPLAGLAPDPPPSILRNQDGKPTSASPPLSWGVLLMAFGGSLLGVVLMHALEYYGIWR